MHTEYIDLMPGAPGQRLRLQLLRFGDPDARPKATLQAALHADEVPALLVAQQLRTQLAELERAGRIRGCIQLLPYANPIGLSQQLLGQHEGRFDLRDGGNFNRQHADLAADAGRRVAGRLRGEPAADTALVRTALREAAAALPAATPAQDLKRRLLQLAIDSDIVLDLHCDGEALMHLYALTPQAALAQELGALLQAQALLLADESGDGPFDEACSRPWLQLQHAHPTLPLACFAATVELRGQADTDHALARADAQALLRFLGARGLIEGLPPPPPASAAGLRGTPLAGSEPITAPHAGVVVYRAGLGARLRAGDLVAELVDPASGDVTPLHCQADGLLYARAATRWAAPGKRLAKIAGTALARTGKLLSP